MSEEAMPGPRFYGDQIRDEIARGADREEDEARALAEPRIAPRVVKSPIPPCDPSEETLAQRLLRGRVAGAQAGNFQSGPAPYGYSRGEFGQLEVVEDEAAIVRFVFRVYLRVRSMARLCKLLHELGSTTRRGEGVVARRRRVDPPQRHVHGPRPLR